MAAYDDRVNAAVLLPVKAFGAAKARLASALTSAERQTLVRWTTARVLDAASELPTYVVCDDEEVASWVTARGAQVIWAEQLGLNGAVDHGVAEMSALGHDHVIVVHADLPIPSPLAAFSRQGTVTLVPDRRSDGTNLMSFPVATPVPAAYGPGSFTRHLSAAMTSGSAVEVIRDPRLALDIDHPTDLLHPLVRPLIHEVLPTWLPTNPANPFPSTR